LSTSSPPKIRPCMGIQLDAAIFQDLGEAKSQPSTNASRSFNRSKRSWSFESSRPTPAECQHWDGKVLGKCWEMI
jgi:hypothetical protein